MKTNPVQAWMAGVWFGGLGVAYLHSQGFTEGQLIAGTSVLVYVTGLVYELVKLLLVAKKAKD